MKRTRSTLAIILLSGTSLLSCTALVTPERSFRCHSALASHDQHDHDHGYGISEETPKKKMAHTISRRSSVFALVGLSAGITATLAVPISSKAADNTLADANTNPEGLDEATQKAAAKEKMAQRIAESKLKYRKPTDLVMERKENTDYSCVSTTGSPCPEGLVPAAVQRELVGALQKQKKK
mmetsp:Transcript_29539/g.45089  ORF Transcript_29539/g.45089 Transcript_29539/m.45089 type:complete len:181 (-) Transcript_29539:119-661(-)